MEENGGYRKKITSRYPASGRFLSCMAFSVTVSFAPLASRVVSLLYTPDARDNICSQDTSRCWISINADAPIKDGTVSSHQFVFAWTGKNDSKTQRVRRKAFPFQIKPRLRVVPIFPQG